MRNPVVCHLVAILAIGLVACGPSSKELSGAKSAHYKGDKLLLFAAAKSATEAKYKLQKSDETTLGLQTDGRWYTPEGLAAAERGGDMRDVPDKSLQIALVVTLQPDGDAWVVNIKPLMIRYHAGSPKPEPVAETDPSVPGWATGKVDQLALDIHDALKTYEVKSVPGAVPPPMGPPGATPAPTPGAESGSGAAPAPAPTP
jgi:hypothetical protein